MSTQQFLPESYDVPTTGGSYMKFENGKNRFRVLSSPILGYEYWVDADGKRKPLRLRMSDPISADMVELGIKHFWAMPVFNYKSNRIEILEITQKSIQKELRSLSKNEDWGSPLEYDLEVTRSGDGLETEYIVTPIPPKPVDVKITEQYKAMTINLDALYDGADPFTTSTEITIDDIEF